MDTIADIGTVSGEIVLSERVVTSEFAITEIVEHIRDRYVRVIIELGPFIDGPDGTPASRRGSSRRMMVIWENEAYDAVRDTWRNEDLIAEVTARL